MKHFYLLILICLFISVNTPRLFAGTVVELKKNKVLLDLEETFVDEGEKIYLIDEEGKKKAIVTILSIRDGQAVAELVKGKPQVGMGLLKATTKPKKKKKKKSLEDDESNEGEENPDEDSSGDSANDDSESKSVRIKKKAGFLGDYSMGSATVSSVTVRSNSYGAMYFHDFGLMRSMNLRIYAGFYQGSSSGSSTTIYGAGNVKYDLSSGRGMIPWIGGGFDLLYSTRGGATPLYRLDLNGGLDIPLSSKSFIPIEAVYAMSLNGGSVSYSYFEIRVGYGWTLR